MSYGGNILTSYPSTLLSDGFVQRTSFDSMYQPSMPYTNNSRLIGDDLSLNQTRYQPLPYTMTNNNTFYPNRINYQQQDVSGANSWRGSIPAQESLVSMNDVTEYSESMATASNTNTASSVARTIEDQNYYGPTKKFSQPFQNSNGFRNPANPPVHTQYPQNTKTPLKKEEKFAPAPKTHPAPQVSKKPTNDEFENNGTSSFRTENPIVPKNPSNPRLEPKQASSIDIEAWLNESKKDETGGDLSAEQAWAVKMNQLQMAQAQKIKDKARSSRALPNETKKFEQKPSGSKTKTNENNQDRHSTYMDSLFDGDYFRRTAPSNYQASSSFQSTKTKRAKPTNNSFAHLYDDLTPNPLKTQTKKSQPSRAPRYEPPTVKKPAPTITTTSWRSNLPRQYLYDSWNPYYYHPDLVHPDYIQKDEEERFREALQVLRAERAEQQQKQISDATAKRLNYGDYVRTSTKEGSLQNPVKPSPWSDFMDLKKGNIYSLSREEKKQLYRQSRSYGERVRHRNISIHSDGETARSVRYANPLIDDRQDFQLNNLTPRQAKNEINSKSHSQTSRRVDSASTKHRMISNPSSRTTDYYRSDDDIGVASDTEIQTKPKRLTKKKSVPARRPNNQTDDSDTEVEQRSVRFRTRPKNESLFTLREERTLESIEGTRTKRNIEKRRK